MNRVSKEQVQAHYSTLAAKYAEARKKLGRALTLSEKILTAHLHHWNKEEPVPKRGGSQVFLTPAAIRMQDATAPMALLQYMQAGLARVAVPTSIHCDHLIRAQTGAGPDLQRALLENDELYKFLRSASMKHGIGFWPPGSGIIHQVVLENYAYPGGLIIGTDSHTPNAGGLGMLAIGVGGADAMEVMAGEPWALRWPKLIGVRLTGKLSGWASPKDVILKLAGILSVSGGTGAIVEYFGPGTASISCTGKATITNMGAELGATTSVFPTDERMLAYLRATGRADIAELARSHHRYLTADPEVEANGARYFDRIIEIDLDKLEPHVVGPHTPDLARPISQLKEELKEKNYPRALRYALIGSCTNSSYEDMMASASVAKQALVNGVKAQIGLLITPGSDQIFRTIERDGMIASLEGIGGLVLANACGPCIGQWNRTDIKSGESNSIITSFNRNFPRRNDNNAATLAFIASPQIVTAIALSGDLGFNPLTDTLLKADGTRFKLEPPVADELPALGFAADTSAFIAPSSDGSAVKVEIKPDSQRLEILAPFAPWDGGVLQAPILLKAKGKCTTDHISPAGPWLKFRGHLTNISENMFSGANNAFTEAPGTGIDMVSGETLPLHSVARAYKQRQQSWVVVGDDNYGEGSSREHAAMSPRFLGCKAIIARSFARIHETNLKKQGILALTFVNAADYDRVGPNDRFTLPGPAELAPDKLVKAVLTREDGLQESISLRHTLTPREIQWLKAGSMLNEIKEQRLQPTPGVESKCWLAILWQWLTSCLPRAK